MFHDSTGEVHLSSKMRLSVLVVLLAIISARVESSDNLDYLNNFNDKDDCDEYVSLDFNTLGN